MNRSRCIRAIVLAVSAVSVWALVGTGPASGADLVELGWWSRNPLSSAPDGGFAVGAAPDGPTAVAALRVDLGGGVETLVLDVTPTTDLGSLGSLEVCAAPDDWAAATAGALDDAPATECAGDTVPFGRAGEQYRADVSSLVLGRTGPTSLAVVPVAGSGAVPYEVTFEAPIVVATGAVPAPEPPASGGSGTGGSAGSPPATAAPPPPSPSPAPPAIAIGGTGSPSLPTTTVPAAPATTAPAAPAAEAEQEASSTFELANAGLLDGAASDPRWGEALVLVLIGLAVGAGTYGSSRFAASRS